MSLFYLDKRDCTDPLRVDKLNKRYQSLDIWKAKQMGRNKKYIKEAPFPSPHMRSFHFTFITYLFT